jgi:hypothetical protein
MVVSAGQVAPTELQKNNRVAQRQHFAQELRAPRDFYRFDLLFIRRHPRNYR